MLISLLEPPRGLVSIAHTCECQLVSMAIHRGCCWWLVRQGMRGHKSMERRIRLIFWEKEVNLAMPAGLKKGDVVRVRGGRWAPVHGQFGYRGEFAAGVEWHTGSER